MMMVVMMVMVVILRLCGRSAYPEHHNQREHCKHSAFHLHKLSYTASTRFCEAVVFQ